MASLPKDPFVAHMTTAQLAVARADDALVKARLGGGCTRLRLRAGQAAFRQGDTGDAVFYVEDGAIQLRVLSAEGKEAILAVLGHGDFFGESCLAGYPLHLTTAVATTAAAVTRIDKAAMTRLVRDDPRMAAALVGFLLARNVQVEADLAEQMIHPAEHRLARLLLEMASSGPDGKLIAIPNVSQRVLAARVGTTRSRINQFMNRFRTLGYIEYGDELTVHASLNDVLARP